MKPKIKEADFGGADEETGIGVDNGGKEQPQNGVFDEHKDEEKPPKSREGSDGEEKTNTSERTPTYVPPVCDSEESGSNRSFGPRLRGPRRASFDINGGRPRRRSSFFSKQNSNNSDMDDVCDYWIPPPVEDADDPNSPLRVDFRCACFKLADISTVYFTTLIKFVVVFEWNDSRLKGISTTTNDLPGDLWGPDIILENAQNDCKVIYDSFSLLDAASGRLKRTVTFHGHVYNPMSLKDFPFDEDDLEMKFISICNWRTLDGSRHGNDPCNKVYHLAPMLDSEDVPFFIIGWGGKVNEFDILGWNQTVMNFIDEPSKPIIFKFDFHLVRKAQFYILKVILPLWIIILTSLAPYGIEPLDYQGRLDVLFTLLLSTVALLYVVQESIPKISFLTLVDKVVIMTLLSLSLSVLFSYLTKRSANPERMNFIFAVTNQALFWLANILLLVPPYLRYKKHIAKVEAQQELKEVGRHTGIATVKKVRASFRLVDFTQSFIQKEDMTWSRRELLDIKDCESLEGTEGPARKTQ